MKLGVYSLMSPINDPEQIEASLADYWQALESEFTVEKIEDLTNQDEYDLTLVFVKSGGTENQFTDIYDQLESPVLLVSTPLHNSLAASMEILSWIQSQGGQGRIIHGSPEQITEEVANWVQITKTKKGLAAGKLGVIGEPSDWLIDSAVDAQAVEENWGLEVVPLKIEKVIDCYEQISDEQAQEISEEFIAKAEGMVENTKEDVYQAAKVYLALKEVIAESELTAVTVRCFDLLTELETTGCLALAWLTNEGVIAGCEGDVPATFTMMLSHYLTGEYPFMANLYQLDRDKNELLFAHCTVPTAGLQEYTLRSHFESGIGAAIQGKFEPSPVTIVKVGGSDLTDYVIKTGRIKENRDSPHACRSQIVVELDGSSDYFVTDPIANHHIIIPGNYKAELETLFSSCTLELNQH